MNHSQKILLLGSCFTDHIGDRLKELKFSICQNPHGIIYDPFSINRCIKHFAEAKKFTHTDLVLHNELWHSWDHHSSYSGPDPLEVIDGMNSSVESASKFIQEAEWIIITLGSSYAYQLTGNGQYVANCHKAPAGWFQKQLISINDSIEALQGALNSLQKLYAGIKIILTVSPVRHVKDGITENNRSKARLIEVVHQLASNNNNVFYFPAFELAIDVLRDYRFYKEDMVHPNHLAINYIFEKFSEVFFEKPTQELNAEIENILIAKNHKAFHPRSEAHQNFLRNQIDKAQQLCKRHPSLDLSAEINYFEENLLS
ncbi:MAG: GSCFA domain-containing protein [Chitinophagaceae bacterium]